MSSPSEASTDQKSLKGTVVTSISLAIALFAALAGLSWWAHRVTPELRRARNLRSSTPGNVVFGHAAAVGATTLEIFPLVKYDRITTTNSKWYLCKWSWTVGHLWRARNRVWQGQSECVPLCFKGYALKNMIKMSVLYAQIGIAAVIRYDCYSAGISSTLRVLIHGYCPRPKLAQCGAYATIKVHLRFIH